MYKKGWKKDHKIKFAPLFVDEKVISCHREALKATSPDLVVCDFISVFGLMAADQLNLPVVINCPLPLDFLINLIGMRCPTDPARTYNCFGCICICNKLDDFIWFL